MLACHSCSTTVIHSDSMRRFGGFYLLHTEGWAVAVSQYPVPKIIDGDNWLRNPPHPKDKPTLFRCTYVYACQLFRETKKPQLSFFLLYLFILLGRRSTIGVLILSIAKLSSFVLVFLMKCATSLKMSCSIRSQIRYVHMWIVDHAPEGTIYMYGFPFSHKKSLFKEMPQHTPYP